MVYRCPACRRLSEEDGDYCAGCGNRRGRGVHPLHVPIPSVVYIQWDQDGDYTSPPIGPFYGIMDVNAFEREMRKKLRDADRSVQGRVYSRMLATPKQARSWTIERKD